MVLFMNYTYILKCSDGSLYTGWTNDLEKRIRAHNEGKGAKYTKSRRPVSRDISDEGRSHAPGVGDKADDQTTEAGYDPGGRRALRLWMGQRLLGVSNGFTLQGQNDNMD